MNNYLISFRNMKYEKMNKTTRSKRFKCNKINFRKLICRKENLLKKVNTEENEK